MRYKKGRKKREEDKKEIEKAGENSDIESKSGEIQEREQVNRTKEVCKH